MQPDRRLTLSPRRYMSQRGLKETGGSVRMVSEKSLVIATDLRLACMQGILSKHQYNIQWYWCQNNRIYKEIQCSKILAKPRYKIKNISSGRFCNAKKLKAKHQGTNSTNSCTIT